jgi:hypothetical protein
VQSMTLQELRDEFDRTRPGLKAMAEDGVPCSWRLLGGASLASGLLTLRLAWAPRRLVDQQIRVFGARPPALV